MATYQYVDATGKLKTIEASSPQEAISKAPGIAKNSGVSLATGAGTGATPQSGTRNLQLQSGDPASSLMQTGAASAGVANSVDPYTSFNNQLMNMLTRSQTMGTKRFAEQGFNAQEEQNNRVLKKTDSSLIGANPGIQNSVRSASAGALDPTIAQASRAQQTFSEQLQGFTSAVDAARSFKAELEAADENKRSRAAEIVQLALEQGSTGLSELLRTSPDVFKQAGYDTKQFEAVLTGLKAKEAREAAQFNTRYSSSGSSGLDLTASQQTALNNVDAVVLSLDSYRKLYNSLVEEDGTQLTGTEAGQLAGAYNALMFQIAQASGTGALQAADRQVVEAMVPNPTTIAGAGRAWLRGGKQGGLNSIDEARSIMLNKKSAITSGAGGTMQDTGNNARGFEVTAPNGNVYTFDSQAAADAFKRQIGQ